MKKYNPIPITFLGISVNPADAKMINLMFAAINARFKGYVLKKHGKAAADDIKLMFYTQLPEKIVLSSLAVAHAPTKTSYTTGETFNKTGLTCTATFSNSASKVINATNLVVDTTTPLKATDTSVTISYTEDGVTKTCTQAITVTDPAPSES